MSVMKIEGGQPLHGEITIQGSKNVVLPILAASILNKGKTTLSNVPHIADVYGMLHILGELGVKTSLTDHTLIIDAAFVTSSEISPVYVGKMRSSIIILGALLGRKQAASTRFPGGCTIGERPIDLHLWALRQLGASILDDGERIESTTDGLKGTDIHFPKSSVGATENALLAASTATGQTRLFGCAIEPEITELCLFLKQMGVNITGIGTESITVKGTKEFRDTTYEIKGDRIAAGTYLCAAAITGGNITLNGICHDHMESTYQAFKGMGCQLRLDENCVNLKAPARLKALPYLETQIYPGFPTDMQSLFLAALSVAEGDSQLVEKIFENRFKTAEGLIAMGADIKIDNRTAYIHGKRKLIGTTVTAPDLRGGAALIIAGLKASGMTTVLECEFVQRGYEDIAGDLTALGAKVSFKD